MSGLVWSAAAWLIMVYRFRLAALLIKPQMCGSRCLPYCVLLCCTHHHKGAAAPQSTSAPAAAPGGSQQYFAQLNVAITLEMRLPIKSDSRRATLDCGAHSSSWDLHRSLLGGNLLHLFPEEVQESFTTGRPRCGLPIAASKDASMLRCRPKICWA